MRDFRPLSRERPVADDRRGECPIPKFASLRGTLVSNFGIKGTLAIYDYSAGGYNDRNFKSTALGRNLKTRETTGRIPLCGH